MGRSLEPFCKLVSVDLEGLEFVVVPPGAVFADYEISIDDEAQERLGIERAEEAVVYVIVTLAEKGATPTANLLGPVVANRRTYEAAQVIQHGSSYLVATPLGSGASMPVSSCP
ncbi:MAG: flagellar assembly protein FliW [Actinobacteria bacterium]|nr:flagellar assembly protein FliW [Actinomycetota bacterium]